MQIKFHGNSCFYIKDGDLSVLTDPFNGVSETKTNAITFSQFTSDFTSPAEAKVFNWPGEYETGGIYFLGIPSFHNTKSDEKQEPNTLFIIDWNGIRMCHLGRLGTKLTPEQLEQVGEVDILFIPLGGKETIEPKKAKDVIEQIEPRIIIPMLYTEQELSGFRKEMGAEAVEALDLLTVKRSELPEDMSKVVVLKNS